MLNFVCRSNSIYCEIKPVLSKFPGDSKFNFPATTRDKCDAIHVSCFTIKWLECQPNTFFPNFRFLFRQAVPLLHLLLNPTERVHFSRRVSETIPIAL